MVGASLLCHPLGLPSSCTNLEPYPCKLWWLSMEGVDRGEKLKNPVWAFASGEKGRMRWLVCSQSHGGVCSLWHLPGPSGNKWSSDSVGKSIRFLRLSFQHLGIWSEMRISVRGENPRPAQTMSPWLLRPHSGVVYWASTFPLAQLSQDFWDLEISKPNPPWKTPQFPQPIASVTLSRLTH